MADTFDCIVLAFIVWVGILSKPGRCFYGRSLGLRMIMSVSEFPKQRKLGTRYNKLQNIEGKIKLTKTKTKDTKVLGKRILETAIRFILISILNKTLQVLFEKHFGSRK